MSALQVAYAVNVVLLGPIAVSTVFRLFATDQGRFEESAGWRILTGGLWSGIVVLSILGLFHPVRYSPALLVQLVYKSVWLAVYAAPRLLRGQTDKVPALVAGVFAVMLVVWPFIIPWGYLFAPGQ